MNTSETNNSANSAAPNSDCSTPTAPATFSRRWDPETSDADARDAASMIARGEAARVRAIDRVAEILVVVVIAGAALAWALN